MRFPPKAKYGEINFGFTDRFTIAHFLIGIVYGFFGLNFGAAIFLAALWELLENPAKAYLPIVFPHASMDTFSNMLGDCLAVLSGWLVFWYLSVSI